MMPEATPRPSVDDRIKAALWFAERGFGIFTVWSADKQGVCHCPAGRGCEQPGKHPVTAHGFHDATRDPARIRTLLSAGSTPNYGLVCPEGVFALDVDGEGVARLAELEAEHGPLPPTLRTRTAHGEHIFLRWPADLPRPIGQLFGYVTRWGSGRDAGYVIGPRSVHASGAVYVPEGEVFEIAELPAAWARSTPQLQPRSAEIVVTAGAYELPERIAASESRYEAIRTYVAHLYNRGFTPVEMWLAVRDLLAPRFEVSLTEGEVRSRFERCTAKMGDRLGERRGGAREEAPEPEPRGIDAADLLAKTLPPLRMIVPDLLTQGTTILAAPPKVGKSCLVYQIVVEVSLGGILLDREAEQGDCLYLALEDGQLRGQSRLRTALRGREMPHGALEIWWQAPHIGRGLEPAIVEWLDGHPRAAVVAIDTLQKVRPASTGKRGSYEVDVEDMGKLQNIFRDRQVALLIVHHSRKEHGDDFVESVSGTYGITGSTNSTIVIKRARNEVLGRIVATGRDIAEADVAVRFENMTWASASPIELRIAGLSAEAREVLDALEMLGPIGSTALAEHLHRSKQTVQNILTRLAHDGTASRVSGGWITAQNTDGAPSLLSVRGVLGYTESTQGIARDDSASGWLNSCRDYPSHQANHRHTTSGWTCDACFPEESR